MLHVVFSTFWRSRFEDEGVEAIGGGEGGELVPAHVDGVPGVEVGAVADIVAAPEMDSEHAGEAWRVM